MFDSRFAKNGQVLFIFFSSATRFVRAAASGAPSRYALTALPKPYQPVSSKRHWPHEKPHGIARRSSIRRFFGSCSLREAGRLPMFSSAISVIGVAAKK
jgi:hypothetical protein